MPEDLKLSQISSSPLPPPFRGLHSPGGRKHCQIIFACYFWKSSIGNTLKRVSKSHDVLCPVNQYGYISGLTFWKNDMKSQQHWQQNLAESCVWPLSSNTSSKFVGLVSRLFFLLGSCSSSFTLLTTSACEKSKQRETLIAHYKTTLHMTIYEKN